jgi:small-conductance mechanosensitive channel/CRP-like cAMP-binding protein
MAPDSLLAPPAGWAAGAFASNLRAELAAHPTAAGTALALLVLLAVGRGLLPSRERPRLRAALVLFGVYVVSLVARAELLSMGVHDGIYAWLALGGTLALAYGIISVVALLGYDLVATRFGVPRLLRDVTTAIAGAVVLVWLLSRSGVNLLQLVTTSAILTAVIGLALQDTIGNIIAGIAVQFDSAVSIGDWIRIDERTTGRVREIRWRSTMIETKNGDQLLFPNALINRSMVTRFNHSGLEHRQMIYFHAHYRHPPNRVIAVALGALQDVPNVSRRTPVECFLFSFDDHGVRYVVRYRLVDFGPDTATDSEVQKRIWYALNRAEIEIPYPTHNVFVTSVAADRDQQVHERDLRRRLRALARIPLFVPLNDEERSVLAEGLRFLPFARGEIILRQGEAGDSLYVVRDGSVSIRLAIEGAHKEIATLSDGEFFGEMSLLTGEPRRATVTALEDTECYVIDRALFERVLKRNPQLADAIGHLLAERERALVSQREALEAGHRPPDEAALLDRIKAFFGLR